MATDTQILRGTITTDGAGAGSASPVLTGYRLRKVSVRAISGTGGTVSAKGGGGAGGERLGSTTVALDKSNSSIVARQLESVASPLLIAIAGGGASKVFAYRVELKR